MKFCYDDQEIYIMMKTLKYAARFLIRAKLYTLINLLGLAFSLACCIILMRYLHREWTVDTHCIRPNEIVTIIYKSGEFQAPFSQQHLIRFHPDLKEKLIPDEQIIASCEFVTLPDIDFMSHETSYNLDLLAVDSTYFHFFEYPLVEGELRLNTPQDAILTKACAQHLFGKESAVGKVLKVFGKDITIRGIIDQPACKTILNFDILTSYQLTDWSRVGGSWLRIIPKQTDLDAINAKINVFGSVKPDQFRNNTNVRNEYIHWRDIYYDQWTEDTATLKLGNRTYERMLIGVILVLLFIGMVNFINLYMVHTMKRQKEYGIKKIFGLQGFPLFLQVWLENVLLSVSALLVAWLLVEITVPICERLMNEPMKGYNLFDLQLSLSFLVVFPLITSIYPFIKHNYRLPIISLRSVSGNRESIVVRMSFLFLQYAITLILLIVAIYFNRHLNFLQSTPMGFRSEGILYAQLVNESQFYHGIPQEAFKERGEMIKKHISFYEQKLNECPFIEKWTPCRSESILHSQSQSDIFNDKNESHTLFLRFIEKNFFDIHDLKIIDGELPDSEKIRLDQNIVLNETAMKLFGYKEVHEAFIRSKEALWFSFNTETQETVQGGLESMPVQAVVSDFYSGHVSEGVKPILFIVNKEGVSEKMQGSVAITAQKGKEKETVDYLKQMVKDATGSDEFVYSWLQDEVDALYEDDHRLTIIYNIFALVGIMVCCLGLFGISLFDIRRRYREIGIRKVNGARMKDLYKLLFRKYMVVIGIAFVVGTPIAYYLIHQYTADFVVKAPIGIGIFLFALLIVSLISLGTLFWQVRKAANINPADVVKSE